MGTAELDMRKMLFRKALVLKIEAERKGAAEKKSVLRILFIAQKRIFAKTGSGRT
eukprot:COSAG06_NODE_5177_length_3657_cov_4.933671_1_plen_55_part_00